MNLKIWEPSVSNLTMVSQRKDSRREVFSSNSRAVLRRVDVSAILDLDRFVGRFDEAPKFSLKVIFDRDLLCPDVVVRIARGRFLLAFALVDR